MLPKLVMWPINLPYTAPWLKVCSNWGRVKEAYDHTLIRIELNDSLINTVKVISLAEMQEKFDVGLHTGLVVAGIVGVKKYAYDIWGDAVNIASRMKSNGEIGKANISRITFDLVDRRADLQFIERCLVEVKGKGKLEMFFEERV